MSEKAKKVQLPVEFPEDALGSDVDQPEGETVRLGLGDGVKKTHRKTKTPPVRITHHDPPPETKG